MADKIIYLDIPVKVRKKRIFTRFVRQLFGIEKCNYTVNLKMLKLMYKWTNDFEKDKNSFEEKISNEIINQKGKILEQFSFNTVEQSRNDAEPRKIDYHEKLNQREKERDEARKSWQTIGKIAELKESIEDLDKEKVVAFAKEKATAIKEKCDELVHYVVEKGTPVMEKTANTIREKATAVSKEVVEKLENKTEEKEA